MSKFITFAQAVLYRRRAQENYEFEYRLSNSNSCTFRTIIEKVC